VKHVRAAGERGRLAWEDPVDRIAGLGPAAREALGKAGVRAVADLAWLLPSAWDDLRAPISIADAVARAASGAGERVCMCGVVTSAGLVPMRGRRAVRVVVGDSTAVAASPRVGPPSAGPQGAKPTLHAWWFFAAHGVLAAAKVGARVLLVGRVRVDAGKPARVAHGDLIADAPGARVVRPRYPRLGVAEATLRAAVASAVTRIEAIPDPVPAAIAAREAMPRVDAALRAVHAIAGDAALAPSDADKRVVRERLAWVEAFARVRDRLSAAGEGSARALPRDETARARFVAELGFPLTASQARAIDEIAADLAKTTPMRRLLFGDVGSGKTAVALAAAAQCVAAGAQVAILAPTSVLAEQYVDAAAPLAATGASIVLVSAAVPAAQRRRASEALARGDIAVAIGTHALLSGGTSFARLGLVIVDEQHRLGVAQRLALVGKGAAPHLLTLSATPIPRTLALALRGELATSSLDPRSDRAPVTELAPRASFDVARAVRETCARGERVFFVAPRIEDDDDESGAKQRAAELASQLDVKIALVHGTLSPDAKRAAMRAFRSGAAPVLVATTVIEVGVDVPEATLMIVDGAERFGLAQLHQLRGRVGRGARPGRCVLLHGELDDLARRRLEAVRDLRDGASIARADLALRGAGDLGGTRQSGAEEELRFLDPASPPPWLERIEGDVRDLAPNLAAHPALALAVARYERALAVREEAG